MQSTQPLGASSIEIDGGQRRRYNAEETASLYYLGRVERF